MGLGLTRDLYLCNGIDNAWMNVGCSQYRLPIGPAQVLLGVTGLVMPDLDGLMARLASIESLLKGTKFAFMRPSRPDQRKPLYSGKQRVSCRRMTVTLSR